MTDAAQTVEESVPIDGRSMPRASKLMCRRMTEEDIAAAVDLLAAGFPDRGAPYWRRALDRLRTRTVPDDCPRYGYVLTDQSRLVGIILVIFAVTDAGHVRGNVSSWYVEPYYRGYSHLLLSASLKRRDAALINISPAPTTVETITAQGFARYVDGSFIAFAILARPVFGVTIRRVTATGATSSPILRDHASWDCLAFELTYAGETQPFVFTKHRFLDDAAPCAQLVYCRSIQDFQRFAGPLGRRLLRHGLGVVFLDANGPLEGLVGVYRPGRSSKFSRGAPQPRLGDLSYTELAVFGS